MTRTFHDDVLTFMTVSAELLFSQCEMFQTNAVGKIKTYILCSVTFFLFSFFHSFIHSFFVCLFLFVFCLFCLFVCLSIYLLENPAVYEIIRKNTVQPDRPQMAIRRMRFTCCITLQTHTQNM